MKTAPILALAFSIYASLLSPPSSLADSSPTPSDLSLNAARIVPADDAWRVSLPRDPEAATEAYLARIPKVARERANAYFEGGYWLQLWNFLSGILIAALLLETRATARVRDWFTRKFRSKLFRTIGSCATFFVLLIVFSFPLNLYQGYFREHRYGLLNQGFGDWFKEQLIAFAIGVVVLTVLASLIFGVIRKFPRSWHIWGTACTMAVFIALAVLQPVYISPLFNNYQSVPDGPVRTAVLSLARQNGIPAKDVYVFDASKQSDRVSANVSGMFATTRISLNDNLLNRSARPEVKAVMGHEMGHYVLHHVDQDIVDFAIIVLAGLTFVRWATTRAVKRSGKRWGIADLADTAALPLFLIFFSTYLFVLTPLTNSLSRRHEAEADLFGINTSREPDGDAEADLKLTEYRKPDPGTLEEIFFFDHPSTRSRIHMAMQWKAENWPGE